MIKLKELGEDIKQAARDARINLSAAEEAELESQLENILKEAVFLEADEVTHAEPTHYPYEQHNTLREDVAAPSMPQDKVLQNAPEADEIYFLVPKIIE